MTTKPPQPRRQLRKEVRKIRLKQRVQRLEKEVAALKAQLEKRPEVINVTVESVDSESFRELFARVDCNDLVRKHGN